MGEAHDLLVAAWLAASLALYLTVLPGRLYRTRPQQALLWASPAQRVG